MNLDELFEGLQTEVEKMAEEAENKTLMKFHEMSLSADPVEAVHGRMAKELYPAMRRLMRAELTRLKNPREEMPSLICGMSFCFAALQMAHIETLAGIFGADRVKLMKGCAEHTGAILTEIAEKAAERPTQTP